MIFDGFIKNLIYDPVSTLGILTFYFFLPVDDTKNTIFEKDLFFLFFLVISIFIYLTSQQYKGLTRTIGSTSFYKIALSNIFVTFVLILITNIFLYHQL